MNLIEGKSVVKRFGQKTVLSFKKIGIEKGKTYLLLGENGSGKSTLIKMVLGFLKPSAGHLSLVHHDIGYIPERINLPEFITVSTFLKLLLEIRGVKDSLVDHRIKEHLKEWDLEDKLIYKLSKGMRQKLLIIQALIHHPKVYIFDEPLSGLDQVMQKKFIAWIAYLKRHKKTILISTHYAKYYRGVIDVTLEIKDGTLYEKSH